MKGTAVSHPETDHGRILLSGTEQTTRGGLNRRTLLTGSGALAALSFGGTLMAPRIASAAGGYIYPTSSRRVSDSFADHVARGSVNPGTDYVCPTGTRVVAVKAGTVVGITNTIGGSGGRMVFIDHPDGSKTDYLHLSVIQVGLGAQVAQGQQIALSGGSGNGSENGYGAHLHLSLHVGAGAQHATRGGSVDFEAYVGEGGSSAPGPLRQVYSTNAGASWQSGDTGLLFNPSQLSAVNMGGGLAAAHDDAGGRALSGLWDEQWVDLWQYRRREQPHLHERGEHGRLVADRDEYREQHPLPNRGNVFGVAEALHRPDVDRPDLGRQHGRQLADDHVGPRRRAVSRLRNDRWLEGRVHGNFDQWADLGRQHGRRCASGDGDRERVSLPDLGRLGGLAQAVDGPEPDRPDLGGRNGGHVAHRHARSRRSALSRMG
ncbi:M23 peptidase domain protein [Stigmatella aurantiaca DW4/3-1]|uniref:M23 peptidase domain protein n=1 Tax=Stigmatella aurantiaca (strain DW4/3-1) TaxID=378806 RepID=Q08RD2_STIAD|nr:M23 peptidase domain protein [Stigmatella aurantiaca DW4/3-1]